MTTKETCAVGFDEILEARGVKRRDFLKLCAGVAAALGLSQTAVPRIAEALEESVIGATSGALQPALWLELASCTGCTESLAQAESPDVATILLELISLNYAETLSAGAGHSLEHAKEQTIEAGGYLLFIEGALMEGWDGDALLIAEERGIDIVDHAAPNAAAIICVGSCAVDGGWQAAHPNPGGAIGIPLYLQKSLDAGRIDKIPPIINVPLCPANPEHLIAILVEYLLVGNVPKLNNKNKPQLMFSQTVHDNCPRRGHFENGEFVYEFGTEEERKAYCLYTVGCKGPMTYSNCPIVRWNRRTSWCVEAGAPCAGCATADPDRQGFNWVDLNAPFLRHLKNVGIGGITIEPAFIAYAVTGLALVAFAVHGFGMKKTGRTKGGAPYELERKWDKEHPDQAIGAAEAAMVAAGVESAPVPEEAKAAPAADELDEAAETAEDTEATEVTEAAEATENDETTTTEEGGSK